jgi:hypothetical protein
MSLLVLKLTLAPGLVAATTLAGRRWGPRVGGWLGGLPVVVGPILLALALQHGERFAAAAATGALLGLLALNAFIVAYAWLARVTWWLPALAGSWTAFALATLVLDGVALAAPPALAVVLASFFAAAALLPRTGRGAAPPAAPRFDLLVRAGATAALVLTLTALSGALGPRLSGLLAAFPVLATVLAVFTHTQEGDAAVAEFLRGLVGGLASFAVFCFAVAELLPAVGVAAAFLIGSAAALVTHGVLLMLQRGGRAPAPAA